MTDLKGGGLGSACTERSCNELNGPGDDDHHHHHHHRDDNDDDDYDDDDDKNLK